MRVGIIGTNWGRMHVGAFRAAGASIVGICGRDEAKTLAVAREEGVELSTTDVTTLCRSSELVVVASPDREHAAHIRTAWKAGCAVLCEKPLTFSAEEATALSHESRAQAPSAMNFPYRQLPSFRALKSWLGGRRIRQGLVTVRNGFVPVEEGGPEASLLSGSADFGGLSHVLDASLWLAGAEPTWVQASLQGGPVHSAALHLELSRGTRWAVNHLAAPEPGIHGSWSLVGEDWEVGLSAGYVPARGGWCLSTVRVFEQGQWRDLSPALEPAEGQREPWDEAHVAGARAMLEHAAGRAAPELATFEDGARVQRVIAAAAASERDGRRCVLRR